MAPMSFITRAAVVLSALLAPVCAQTVAFTNSDYTITAGSAFSISWVGDGSPVTVVLLNGPPKNLQKVADIATTSTSPYSWMPSSSLAADTYALSITQSGYTNYSPRFTIVGATGTSSVIPGTSSATTSATTSGATSAAASAVPSVQRAQLAPTPAYIVSGGLTSGNGTWPYYATANGTGVGLPTGTSGVGQYAFFEGRAVIKEYGIWRSILAVAVLTAMSM